jgi:phage gpG-like protein
MKLVEDSISPVLTGLILEIKGITGPVSIIMMRDMRDHYQKEQGPDGLWPPLSPITIALRRKQSDKPLQDTGQMIQSLRTEHTETEAAVVETKYDADFGINVPRLHEYGGPGKRRNKDGSVSEFMVPPRPRHWLSDFARAEILDLASQIAKRLNAK